MLGLVAGCLLTVAVLNGGACRPSPTPTGDPEPGTPVNQPAPEVEKPLEAAPVNAPAPA